MNHIVKDESLSLRNLHEFFDHSSSAKSQIHYLEIKNENANSEETLLHVTVELLELYKNGTQQEWVVLAGDGKMYEHHSNIKCSYGETSENNLLPAEVDTDCDLVNIFLKQRATPEQQHDLMSFREVGEQATTAYIEHHIIHHGVIIQSNSIMLDLLNSILYIIQGNSIMLVLNSILYIIQGNSIMLVLNSILYIIQGNSIMLVLNSILYIIQGNSIMLVLNSILYIIQGNSIMLVLNSILYIIQSNSIMLDLLNSIPYIQGLYVLKIVFRTNLKSHWTNKIHDRYKQTNNVFINDISGSLPVL